MYRFIGRIVSWGIAQINDFYKNIAIIQTIIPLVEPIPIAMIWGYDCISTGDGSVSAPEPFVSTDYHIIVDCSNIFIGSQTIRDPTTGATQKNPAIRVNVKNLVRVVENDKLKIYIKTRIAGGSKPPENLPVWKEWASCGYKCIVIERSASGPEDGVDEMLHAQILQLLHIYKDTQTRSQVLVLVTGDGNINGGRTSFLQSVESVLTSNWSVELWSWERSLSQHFLSTQRFFPSRMTIKYLDSYRNDITFIQKPREN
ncbi:unnamed protein product [Rotaria magnacalcarata]|uniref:NYN domain-containing protein n=1 Tax=Rotaria magnacalcarata TaxID=392030 RepID=A0A819E2B8_9BILA|nr:unnamed protein product [Rotaria magnacalcarata]